MDGINDDKSIQENRKVTVSGEISLRDQIVKKLFKQLKEDNVGNQIVEMWQQANSDRNNWLQRQEEYLADYDEFIDIEPQGLFESSSNIHVPVALWTIRTFHARFLQTLMSPDPSVSIKARKLSMQDAQFAIEDFMKYAMTDWMNYHQGIEESLDKWVWSWVTSGVGYLKLRWDQKFQKFEDVLQIPVEKTIDVFDPITNQWQQVPVSDFREEAREVIQKVFEGPVTEHVNIEDLVVVGPDMLDIDGSDAVIQRHRLTASDLNTLADLGIFDSNAVDAIIESGDDSESGGEGSNLKQARVRDTTLDKTYDHKRYEILEAYVAMDVFETGINSQIIVWVHTKSKEILRATYLNRMNPQGFRPYSAIGFHKRSGTNANMPMGLSEMIYSICREIDAIHNMRIDFGLISTMPFGFYRASSSLDPKTIDLQPGQLIPLDNPQADVYFPQLGNRTAFGLQEESQLYTMLERLTGVSDLALGSMSGRQGATRTATGVRSLNAEMNTNLDVPLKRLNRGWKRYLELLLVMLQQRTPKGLEYRVTGDDGISRYAKINDPAQLAGQFDIEVSSSSASSNKQIQLENATQVLQICQNPLFIQIGVVTPQNIYEGIKNYYKVLGIRDVSRFLNGQFENQVILFPKEEIERILGGERVPVLPNMDHDGFIGMAQEIMQDDNKLGKLTPQQTIFLQSQMQRHAQMKQAMEMAAAQQANQLQQNANAQIAQTGQQSAPAAPVGGVSEGGME